jgi:hypothetical protein
VPKPTEEILSAAIAVGELGAITIDTSIFDRYGDDLQNKVLLGLKQFNGTRTRVLFSDIIISEVKAHIARRARETVSAILKELRDHRKVWCRNETVEELGASAHLTGEPNDFADQQWRLFATAVEADVLVANSLVRIDELTERYFASAPPFSSSEKKKSEFPDAIALLSFEKWGASNNKKVLAISRDEDWQDFAIQSDHVFCLPDIPEALDHFNREARFIAERTMAFLQEQDIADVGNDIANAVERFFDDTAMEIEAHGGSYGVQAELQGGALQYWKLHSGPLILTAEGDEITFVVELDCKVGFEANLSWSFYGDGEWHDIGPSTNAYAENDCRLQFTISCSRKIEDEPEVYEVTITSRPITIDFGYVDPGWGYEE